MTEGIGRGRNFPRWLRVVTEASAHTERGYVGDLIKTLFFFHLAQMRTFKTVHKYSTAFLLQRERAILAQRSRYTPVVA